MSNQKINSILLLTARLTLFILFFPAGLDKMIHFSSTVAYINSVGLPFATIAAIGAIVIEIIGSILLLLGYKQRLVFPFFIIFTLLATLIFHNFWAFPVEMQKIQSLLFFKNLGVIGGMLALFVASKQIDYFSLDSFKRKKQP
ncbi:DoxX family protein [Thorsellia kenyensis]|uniref:DoxX family protein n=1 Tax=Thorsellia kenyensis TaxID=1549888 RepID=A0ABV6C6M7_9GAMM